MLKTAPPSDWLTCLVKESSFGALGAWISLQRYMDGHGTTPAGERSMACYTTSCANNLATLAAYKGVANLLVVFMPKENGHECAGAFAST